MDGRIEVVDELGTDALLREDHANARLRGLRILVQDLEEGVDRRARLTPLRDGDGLELITEPGERLVEALEEFPQLPAVRGALVCRQTLRRVRAWLASWWRPG